MQWDALETCTPLSATVLQGRMMQGWNHCTFRTHKEHHAPFLPLFYGAGNELCVVCKPVYPGASVRLALEYLSV